MADTPKWTAIILAGRRPQIDALSAAFDVTHKALIPVAGRPMIAHVADALLAVNWIGAVVVLAQDSAALVSAVPKNPRIGFADSAAGISASINAIAGHNQAPWPVFITTADHPLLSPEMITAFLSGADGADIAVGMVERSVVLSAYPENKRTWLKFSDGHWSGANLFALRNERARIALDTWAAVEQDRKKAWKLFLHFGPWLALRALTRTIGLDDALHRAAQKLGFSARLVSLPFAEAAIDVDKLSDHQQVEGIFQGRRDASPKSD